jgi:hypothetical protein
MIQDSRTERCYMPTWAETCAALFQLWPEPKRYWFIWYRTTHFPCSHLFSYIYLLVVIKLYKTSLPNIYEPNNSIFATSTNYNINSSTEEIDQSSFPKVKNSRASSTVEHMLALMQDYMYKRCLIIDQFSSVIVITSEWNMISL